MPDPVRPPFTVLPPPGEGGSGPASAVRGRVACQDPPMSETPAAPSPGFDTRGVLRCHDADGVRLLTFDRPEALNAFNQALWLALVDGLVDAAERPDIGCVVITGNGRGFTAGQDLAEMADPSVFTSGEEWGLRGSRAALSSLKERYAIQALINVDSIGRAKSKPTHVIGISTHAGLGKRVQAALEAEGLASGKDIDAYAYKHGSDHWPFHEDGIPAVTLWASEYSVMNTGDDTLDKVEPEGIAKVAAALARLLADVKGLAEAAQAR